MAQIVITEGQAYIRGNGLRCLAPRKDDPSKSCNKLVAKKNAAGEISGAFQCPDRRCRQQVSTEVRR